MPAAFCATPPKPNTAAIIDGGDNRDDEEDSGPVQHKASQVRLSQLTLAGLPRGGDCRSRARDNLTQDPYLAERTGDFRIKRLSCGHFVVVEQPFMPFSRLGKGKGDVLRRGSEVERDDGDTIVRPPFENDEPAIVVDQQGGDVVELQSLAQSMGDSASSAVWKMRARGDGYSRVQGTRMIFPRELPSSIT